MIKSILLLLITLYRYLVSPLFPPLCKYQISCSAYMYNNVKKHGGIIGLYLGLARLLSCAPWRCAVSDVKHGAYK